MNVVDIVLILGVLTAALHGWRVGLLMSLVSFLSILAAYVAALAFGAEVAGQLAGGNADPESGSALIGFVVVFILTMAVCYIVGRIVSVILRATPFGLIDGAGGALTGAAGGILLLGLAIILLRTHPPHEDIPKWVDESSLGATAQRSALVLLDALNSAIPGTDKLGQVLGVRVDPSSRPALVDQISGKAGSAKARLDSLLSESRKRLESK